MFQSCDACSTRQYTKGSKIPDHKHEQLFTFGICYAIGEHTEVEEIDIWAGSFAQASDLARITADEGYLPGYTEIVTMAPGGSGGLIQIWSTR
jgi:hypothetical protein